MQRKIKVTLFILALCLSAGCGALIEIRIWKQNGNGTETEMTSENIKAVSDTSEAGESLTGWRTYGKKRFYYEGGRKVTGWYKVGKRIYYFDEKGVMQTNRMIQKNYYVGEKGVLVDKSRLYENGKEGLKKLRQQLEQQLCNYSGTWSIYVKNLDTNEYCSMNNQQMNPASLIKLYNMAYVYKQMEEKEITDTNKMEALVERMITVSNNDAYNNLLIQNGDGNLLLGTRKVNIFCQEQGYMDTQASGTLKPSKVKGQWLCNAYTTVEDCGHILEEIYRGTLISEKASASMLECLKRQQKTSKIPSGLPEGIDCANKTGESEGREHDAAIIFSRGADYILVVMTEKDKVAVPHIREVSGMVYEYFNS